MECERHSFLSTDISRYRDAYLLYFLSMRRFLANMSIVARYMSSAHYARKYRIAYTPRQRKIADKYCEIAPYTELEIVNCIIHARILLDRVAALSSRFLRSGNRPSFKSFSDHKKFFTKLTAPYGEHDQYAEYIRTKTDWFEMPLKAVRDNFVVHSAPKHMRSVVLPNNFEVQLLILKAEGSQEKPLSQSTPIILSPLRMSRDIEEFLSWFCSYAINNSPKTVGHQNI